MCTAEVLEFQNFDGDKPIWCRGVATGDSGGMGFKPPSEFG